MKYFIILSLLFFVSLTKSVHAGETDSLAVKTSVLNNLENGKFKTISKDNVDELIKVLTPAKGYSGELSRLIIEKADSIKHLRDFIQQTIKDQTPSSYSLIRSKSEDYLDKEILIEGRITDIGDRSSNSFKVTISDVFECEFEKSPSGEEANYDLGDKVSIKGKAYNIDQTVFMRSCSYFNSNPLTEENNKVVACANGLLSQSLVILKKEIVIHNNIIAASVSAEANSLFGKGDYPRAIEKYLLMKKASNPNIEFINNRIDSAKKFISFQAAEAFAERKNFLQAFEIYDSLSNSKNFNNSKQRAILALSNYFGGQFASIKYSSNLDDHISILNQLKSKTYTANYSQTTDSLFEEYKKTFFDNVKTTILYDLSAYQYIPGGSFVLSNSEKMYFDEMTVRKKPITNKEFMYFLIMSGKQQPESHYLGQLKSIYAQEFEKWLGVKFLTDSEMEYIAADGWASAREHKKFANYSNNYGISVSNLNVRLENTDKFGFTKQQINKIKDDIDSSITQQRQYAYSSGRVERWHHLGITPFFSLNWGKTMLNKYNFMLNSVKYSSDSAKYVFEKLSGNVGLQLAFPGLRNIDSRDTTFNGPAINLSYLFNAKLQLKNTLPAYSHIYISEVAISGPEAELVYVNRAKPSIALFNGTISIGLGVAQYTMVTKYSVSADLKATKTPGIKANNQMVEKINFATVSTNLGLFFFKGYVSVKKVNTYGSLIYGFNTGIKIGFPIKVFKYDIDE